MEPIKFRYWFYTAALYNLSWGCLNIFAPNLYFHWLGITPPTDMSIWQVVGMFVLVYAPAYWWAGRHPDKHYHLVLVGLIGKLFGPIGFVWSVVTGRLAPSFGWVILTNDIIWLPAFLLYFKTVLSKRGPLSILLGE